jgi:glutamyl-tRNA synthetase
MIDLFTLEGVNRAPSTFNPEKLLWLNQQYLKDADLAVAVEQVKERLQTLGIHVDEEHDITPLVNLYRERVKTINELAQSILYIFQDFADYDENAAKKNLKPAALEPLRLLFEHFQSLVLWQAKDIHQAITQVTEDLEVGMGKVGQPLRVAVTGGSFSPPIDLTVELIGKDKTLQRLQRAIGYIEQKIP